MRRLLSKSSIYFNETATTEIYTLSLHDALPISSTSSSCARTPRASTRAWAGACTRKSMRSEEHTSELQSLAYLVCRLLLEKKNNLETCTTYRRLSSSTYTTQKSSHTLY